MSICLNVSFLLSPRDTDRLTKDANMDHESTDFYGNVPPVTKTTHRYGQQSLDRTNPAYSSNYYSRGYDDSELDDFGTLV